MKSTFTLCAATLIALISFGQNKQQPITFSKNDLTPLELEAPEYDPQSARSIAELVRRGYDDPSIVKNSSYTTGKNTLDRLSTNQIRLDILRGRAGGGNTCDLEESFEVSVPPPGWTHLQFNADSTWFQGDAASDGLFSAECSYHLTALQVERLESGPVNLSTLSNPMLSFDWMASYYWAVDPNDNYDLNVSISTNGGGSYTPLWNEQGEGVFNTFQWYTELIDLSAYSLATAAIFRFEYFGLDGAQGNFDNVSVCATTVGAPCTSAAATYNNLVTAGGAPCHDGVSCFTTDAGFDGFGIYGSEAYLLDNVQAGYDYVFDMCTGEGAGSWIPEITILAPDGTTIDATNAASSGSGMSHGQQCSLSWTASQTGEYTIFINEMGTSVGDAPNQVNCVTAYAVDNGNPTVTCGANPFPCLPCEAGALTSALLQTVCPGDTGVIDLDGSQSAPGDISIGFTPGPGALGGVATGFTLTGFDPTEFPYGFDNDLNGVLSFNTLDTLLGTWFLTVYATQPDESFCDSTGVTTVTFLSATDPACSSGPCTTISPSSNGGLPWADLDNNGGAPCHDGNICWTTDAGFTDIGIYGGEGYSLDGVIAGFDYVFDMCSGFGAGNWTPEITILAPDGVTVDAHNAASSTSGLTHGQQCSLAWTATQSGSYTILINQMGTAFGDAPNQADCTTLLSFDNGNPTVTCGTPNPMPCPPCEAGMVSTATTQGVCPGETLDVGLSGNVSPDTYTVSFSPEGGATGGNPNGLNIVEYVAGDFPLSFDSDLNGILSANSMDPLLGTWTVTVYSVNSGFNCDSTTNTITVTFYEANDPACLTNIDSNDKVSFNLFPNPNQGEFVLNANNVNGLATVNVLDMTGKLIFTEAVQMGAGFKKSYDLNVAAGTYVVQLLSTQGLITRKLTIE